MYILGYIYYLNQTLTGGLAYPPATDHVPTWNRNQTQAKRQGGHITGAGLIGTIRRWWAHRAVERELGALSDWVLRDIGIHRGEIPEVAARLVAQEEAKAARRAAQDPSSAAQETNHVQPGHLKLAGCG